MVDSGPYIPLARARYGRKCHDTLVVAGKLLLSTAVFFKDPPPPLRLALDSQLGPPRPGCPKVSLAGFRSPEPEIEEQGITLFLAREEVGSRRGVCPAP